MVHRRWAFAAAVMSMLLAGCGGGSVDASGSTTGSTTGSPDTSLSPGGRVSPTSPSSPGTPGRSSPARQPAPPKPVAWVPPGPASPDSPPPFGWYGLLQEASASGSCDRLSQRLSESSGNARVDALYRALGHACLASIEHRQSEWTPAQRQYAALGGASGWACLDRGAYGLLRSLLSAHAAAPSVPVRVVRSTAARACAFAVTALSLHNGPVDGGAEVVITGVNLFRVTTVLFGTAAAQIIDVGDAGTSITVIAPAGAPGTVDVRVVAQTGTTPATPADRFTFVPAPTASPSQ